MIFPVRNIAAARTIGAALAIVLCAVWSAPDALAIAAPGPGSDAQKTFEDAMRRASTGDYDGAVIQLKNVLQIDPGHLPGRIALGRFLLREGQGASAEKELRIALSLGAAPGEVLPTLGNALLMQRKYEEILEAIKSPDPGAEGDFAVLLLRGRANYELGRLERAEELFEQAATKVPTRPEPWTGLTLVERARGRFETALGHSNRAVELAPFDPESWYQKGETLRKMGNSDAALAALDEALSLNPNLLRARLSRASEYLNRGELELAEEEARFVQEANPQDLMAVFISWRALSGLGRNQEANEALKKLGDGLGSIKEDDLMQEPYLLRLAAWFALARRDLARSERYLDQFVTIRPNEADMQILLGQVKLILGDPRAAIGILHPLSRRYPNNLTVLSQLGQAYFKIGNYGEAAAMFERTAALSRNDVALAPEIALSRIGIGDFDDAISGLQKTVDENERAIRAGLLLTVLQFKSGQREQALMTINSLVSERPNPLTYNMLGIMEAANGNFASARMAFEEITRIAPGFVPARYNLAKLEMAAGQIRSAEQQLLEIVSGDPRNSVALVALADVALAGGDLPGAVDWLEKAVSADPDNVDVQIRRVELYLELGRDSEALNAAKLLAQRKPEDATALQALGEAQAASGKNADARRSFRTAVRFAGFNGPQLMDIAKRQVGLADFDEARNTLQKAIQAPIVATEAATALVRLDIQLAKYDAAIAGIEALRKDDSNDRLTHILRGEVLMAQGRADDALKEYESAHAIDPGPQTIMGLFDAEYETGRREQAISRLEDWVAAHPGDVEAQRKLALWYLPMRELKKSKVLLERLLPTWPNDPVLLSNLARLYQLEGDGRARGLAERAVASRPDWPVALDTLGWILVTEGDVAEGLGYLREAISRENNPLTRYHLAQALSELGRPDEARKELRRLLNTGSQLEWIGDVQRYYDGLADADAHTAKTTP